MTNTYSSLDGKVVLVTGAGKGIGRAIAQRFAGQGCKLVINDIDEANVATVVDVITADGGTAMGAVADVSNSEQVGTMIEAAMEAHGRIDVVVNNAGIVSPMLHFFDADEEWWRRIVDVLSLIHI